MAAPPRSYVLAKNTRDELLRRYACVATSLSGDGVKTRLGTFESLMMNGCPAINMTLPGCVRFLESGRWLNIYEVVALQVKARQGPAFERVLRRKLGIWYTPPKDFEKLLKFRRDTHYAALNLGGGGPDYGECCVRLGTTAPLQFSTTFAGDPLRVAIDEKCKRVLSDTEVLERFGTYDDRAALAAVTHRTFLDSAPIINRDTLIQMLDDRETLVEVHLYGAVRREHAIEIAIQPDFFMALGRRCIEYEEAPTHARNAKTFSTVRVLKRLLELTDLYGVRLRGEARG